MSFQPAGEPLPTLVITGAARLATAEGSAALPAGAARLHVEDRAALACVGGRIAWRGPEAQLPEAFRGPATSRLDAAGGVLVPGFVDAHTHAVFAGWRADEFGRRLAGATYAEIAAGGGGIVSTMAATRAASEDELADLLLRRLDHALLHGVTTMEIKSGYGLDLESELRQLRAVRRAASSHPVRLVPTFLGAHAVPPEMRARREEYVRRVAEEILPLVAAEGLARACDVFCDQGAFTIDEGRRILQAARALGLLTKVHADELTSCGGAELAAEMGAVSAEHLLHASDRGLELMARAGTVAVLLPATAFLLREPPALAERFRRAGCPVAVGTDFNPGSSPCESLTLAAAIGCVANGLSADEALLAITLNAAASAGLASETGSLEPGKAADVVVLDAPTHEHLPYRFGTNLVRHVVRAGRVVVREGRVVVRDGRPA